MQLESVVKNVTEIKECYLCTKVINDDVDAVFTVEFDSFIHETCLKQSLESGDTNPELLLIAREFSSEDPYYKKYSMGKYFSPTDKNQLTLPL